MKISGIDLMISSHPATWAVFVAALVALAALLSVEWSRPGSHRAGRLGATILTVVALALWAVRPAWNYHANAGNSPTKAAALWTGSATPALPAPDGIEPRYRFALPGANVPADAGVTFVPDAGTIRRRFPEVGELKILGGGLDPADLPALAGWRVELVAGPGTTAEARQPCFLSLRCPRELPLGEPVVIEGHVGGVPAGKTAPLTLAAPDGATTAAATAAADAHGEASFTIRAPAPPAAGRFLWKLALKAGPGGPARAADAATLGLEVRAPSLPRVLVLESAPRFDTANLRRWYEEAGGTLRARLRIGQDRYRFFAAGAAATPAFDALDPALLAGFDLVLADGRALASLPAPEREILRAAVAETGLGVLVLADDALLPPAVVAADRAWLFPWQLRTLDPATDGGEHLARLFWPGGAPAVDVPLPATPYEIVLKPGQTCAVRDDQQRVLAASSTLGRGTIAVTLVRESGRWLRADAPEAFAGYWSFLFGQTARRLETSGRWTLADGDNGPIFVDHPLELRWSGPPPGAIRITDESGAPPVALAPASDPREPSRWRTTFWPRRPGWQRLESAGGRLDFYVDPAGSWPELASERRRAATERFAASSEAGVTDPVARPAAEPTPVPAGWWCGAFLLGAGFLWVERRLAAG